MAMGFGEDGESSLMTKVRVTCKKLIEEESSQVKINRDRVVSFVESMDWTQFEELAALIRFPLAFRSVSDEVNFMVLLDLLNFGSGFRKELHRYCDKGAYETMTYGVMGMYISTPQLDCRFMQRLTLEEVASFFNLPLDRDEEISTGIYVSKPKWSNTNATTIQGPLRPLASMIHRILNESGKILEELGYSDFGDFVFKNLHDSERTKPSAVHLATQLVERFPAFDDSRVLHGYRVYFLKRAQLAVSSIYRRFKDTEPQVNFEDITELTAFSDNVLPCVLNAVGVLEYDATLTEHINSGRVLEAGIRECELRAGAIVACEEIVSYAKGRMTILDLDNYLWRLGKEPAYRSIERHATQDTFCY